MKKVLYILLPLFLLISLFAFLTLGGLDTGEQTDHISDEISEIQMDNNEYGTHVPETEFEIGLRDIIDEPLQEYIGYSQVMRSTNRNDYWSYQLNSPMTKEDWIALDSVLDHPSITYTTSDNDESVTFEMLLVEDSVDIESVEGFTAEINIEGTTYIWSGTESSQILHIRRF